jgi:hypothetical protein
MLSPANAQAFTMFVSLQKLNGTVSNAASKYNEALSLLRFQRDGIGAISTIANNEYWAIIFGRIILEQKKIEQELERSRFYHHIK